jgi:hypothetical protein
MGRSEGWKIETGKWKWGAAEWFSAALLFCTVEKLQWKQKAGTDRC